MIEVFYKISSVFTGFSLIELQKTGVAREYLDALIRSTAEENVRDLLDFYHQHENEEIAEHVFNHEMYGAMIRSLIQMWYLGSWYPLPKEWHKRYGGSEISEYVVSASAYKTGLIWKTIGTHAPGTNPSGFGVWATEPKETADD